MTASVAMAQNADSVIVIYKNQKTIIPVPAYKSQTSISYSDSTRVIEIGVAQRKPGDISLFPQFTSTDLTNGKPANTSKWFSQVEAGFVFGYKDDYYNKTLPGNSNGDPYKYFQDFYFNNWTGYQIRLLLHEKEHYFNQKYSFISGVKLGFAQSFIPVKSNMMEEDSLNNVIESYDNSFQLKVNTIHFLYQFGISYHFKTGKLPARISLGNCVGFSVANIKGASNLKSEENILSTAVLQPFLGLEIGKVGLMGSVGFNVPHIGYYKRDNDFGLSVALSLTYRVF
jgi:hypothetical protein